MKGSFLQFASLEVLLDPLLSLEAQVASVAWGIFYQLCMTYQLATCLNRDRVATVLHTLVTSCWDR